MVINNHFITTELDTLVSMKKITKDKESFDERVNITVEHNMDIYVNDRLTFRVVCTPDNLDELVIGRLLTEGIIDNKNDIESIYICAKGNSAKVFLDKTIVVSDELKNEPTCCMGNKRICNIVNTRNMQKIKAIDYQNEWIFALADEFAHGSKIHKKTQGTHSAYLMYKGEIVCVMEDIGRHNALDKVVGFAIKNDINLSECILFTSGRVPVDMIEKTILAGIPILVSKAVPTNKGVLLAKEYGLTLICKSWSDSFILV